MTGAQQPQKKPKIGFIGNRYVGKHIADNFEARGYPVVRYALEASFNENKEIVRSVYGDKKARRQRSRRIS